MDPPRLHASCKQRIRGHSYTAVCETKPGCWIISCGCSMVLAFWPSRTQNIVPSSCGFINLVQHLHIRPARTRDGKSLSSNYTSASSIGIHRKIMRTSTNFHDGGFSHGLPCHPTQMSRGRGSRRIAPMGSGWSVVSTF